MKPLAITAYTVTSAAGIGRAAHLAALRAETTGLRAQAFEDAALECWIGAVEGVDGVRLPQALAGWDCRNNRLAELTLQQDGFLDAVAVGLEHRAEQGPDRGVRMDDQDAGVTHGRFRLDRGPGLYKPRGRTVIRECGSKLRGSHGADDRRRRGNQSLA